MTTRFEVSPQSIPDTSDGALIAPQLRPLVVPLDSVTLHPRNPRRGDVGAIAASLARFGQRKPIVVQASTRYVVAGNHLVMAARSLGWTEIAANVQEMDDTEATAFMLADNRTADLGAYDDGLLAELLAELSDADNLLATGYDVDDVEAMLRAAGLYRPSGDPDEVPDHPATKDVYVKTGDLWALGSHRLLVGDAQDDRAVARVAGGQPVDMVWTDPPYGVDYEGGSRKRERIANDALDGNGLQLLIGAVLGAAPLRAGGAFYCMTPTGPKFVNFLVALRAAGLDLKQTLVWIKDRYSPGRADYHTRHEAFAYGWRPGATHYFIDDRTQDTVWEIERPGRSQHHPTTKPTELVARAIRNSTQPGERVYDPFAGSGTTLIAAEMTGRVCVAMEIKPAFAQVAIERWQAYTGYRATRLEPSQADAPDQPLPTASPHARNQSGRGRVAGRQEATRPAARRSRG
jgi:DNA modification methylase